MLQSPTAIDEICGRIAAQYAMPLDEIDPAVRGLIDQLVRERLVERAGEASEQVG
jgi:hypothetical protein